MEKEEAKEHVGTLKKLQEKVLCFFTFLPFSFFFFTFLLLFHICIVNFANLMNVPKWRNYLQIFMDCFLNDVLRIGFKFCNGGFYALG